MCVNPQTLTGANRQYVYTARSLHCFLSKEIMFKNRIFPLALLAVTHSVFAAQPLPSAGSQIQQIPPPPVPQKALPIVELKPGNAVGNEVGDTAKIIVNRLQITGAQAYSESALLAVTGFNPVPK
jgi:hypothetical protein